MYNRLIFVTTVVMTCCAHLTTGGIVHGATYRIKSIASDNYVTAYQHSFLPVSGVTPGKVFSDTYLDHPNQMWDAIAVRPASDSLEAAFWILPKKAVLNDLSTTMVSDGAEKLIKNIVNLRSIDKNAYLIRSIHLDKCFQSEGRNHAATYGICDASKPEQQWIFETVYED